VSFDGTADSGLCFGEEVSETFTLTLNGTTLSGTGAGNPPVALVYSPQGDTWEQLETPPLGGWTQLAVAAVGTNLYAFGGLVEDGKPTAAQWSYQALYTIAIPLVH
jgi:hypothetical protein